jgi:hypothetical protein
MPVKQRVAKDRRPSFSAEALDLFEELERMRAQRSEAFRDKSLRLAHLLGLETEWWCSITHVHERGPGPVHPEGYLARDAWFRFRAYSTVAGSPGAAGYPQPRGGGNASRTAGRGLNPERGGLSSATDCENSRFGFRNAS